MTRRTIQTPAGPVVAVPMTYFINCRLGDREVTGYALRLPDPWADLRLCARRSACGEWVIDHYATGTFVCRGVFDRTRSGAVGDLVSMLPRFYPWAIQRLRAADDDEAQRVVADLTTGPLR